MFVIYVYPERERDVVYALRKIGFVAYSPRRVLKYRKNGVFYKIPETLFPGYVFIDIDILDSYDYYNIIKVSGVGNFVSRTCALAQAEREYILQLCNDGNDIDISKGKISNGKLEITEGFLKKLSHKIIGYNKRQHRATVELTLYGIAHKVVCGVDIE